MLSDELTKLIGAVVDAKLNASVLKVQKLVSAGDLGISSMGDIRIQAGNGKKAYYKGAELAIAGAGVTSIFGRTGAVNAVTTDYAAYYVKLVGSTLTGPLSFNVGASRAIGLGGGIIDDCLTNRAWGTLQSDVVLCKSDIDGSGGIFGSGSVSWYLNSTMDANVGKILLPRGTSIPGNCVEGQIMWDSVEDKLWVGKGVNQWKEIGASVAFNGGTITNPLTIKTDATALYLQNAAGISYGALIGYGGELDLVSAATQHLVLNTGLSSKNVLLQIGGNTRLTIADSAITAAANLVMGANNITFTTGKVDGVDVSTHAHAPGYPDGGQIAYGSLSGLPNFSEYAKLSLHNVFTDSQSITATNAKLELHYSDSIYGMLWNTSSKFYIYGYGIPIDVGNKSFETFVEGSSIYLQTGATPTTRLTIADSAITAAVPIAMSNNNISGVGSIYIGNMEVASAGLIKFFDPENTFCGSIYAFNGVSSGDFQIKANVGCLYLEAASGIRFASSIVTDIAMSGDKITGLGAATTNGDALRYEQLIGAYLPIGGGVLTGTLTVNTSAIPFNFEESDNSGVSGHWRMVLDSGTMRFDQNTHSSHNFTTYITNLAMNVTTGDLDIAVSSYGGTAMNPKINIGNTTTYIQKDSNNNLVLAVATGKVVKIVVG